MSLHCIWSTNSLSEALLKCVNMRGDSDSVAAVVGQMAGNFLILFFLHLLFGCFDSFS